VSVRVSKWGDFEYPTLAVFWERRTATVLIKEGSKSLAFSMQVNEFLVAELLKNLLPYISHYISKLREREERLLKEVERHEECLAETRWYGPVSREEVEEHINDLVEEYFRLVNRLEEQRREIALAESMRRAIIEWLSEFYR